MRVLKQIRTHMPVLLLLLAALLPMGHARAEVRATATFDIANARLLHADGLPFYLPAGIDWYSSNGSAHVSWGESSDLDASWQDYNAWNVGRCLGNCPSEFPPVDTHIPPGGYANARSFGAMQLGQVDPGASVMRADAAATDALGSNGSAGVSLAIRLQPDTNEALRFEFDATPYLNLYRAPATPAASQLWGSMALQVSLFNVTTGQELFNIADEALNHALTLPGGQQQDSLIYDPGTLSFGIGLDNLDPAYDYELRVVHGAYAGVALAVPEPAGGGLWLAGMVIVAAFVHRRRRA